MKPAPFSYHRARSVDDAVSALASCSGTAQALAGGQSLVPMLNLRLVLVDLVVDLGAIAALKVATETPSSIRYGALLPHVAFEERRVPDASNGLMPLVAAHIAYRAVRTRGTIGGAIALADPAADWLTAMLALEAQIALVGPNGRRTMPIADFVTGPYSTALGPAELIEAVEVPRRAATERWGRCKVVRKTGEYAESMAIAVIDRAGRTARVVVGALDGAPVHLPGAALAALVDRSADVREIVRSELAASAFTPAQLELHSNVALRAIKHACE
jgi:aerobic carbon-monoxide dehydrogenase medium subunit